jgi:hypothetical protein
MSYHPRSYYQPYDEPVGKDLKYFESKFAARIEDSREYRQYARRMPSFDQGWDKLSMDISTEVVPMKAVHLPAEALDKLVAEIAYLDRLLEEQHYIKRQVQQMHADAQVRGQNPSVQRAWEKYQILLELVRK